MTYEEALNFDQKWNETQAVNDLERYLLRDELPAKKAVAICMRAAKKQIPKKPKRDCTEVAPCPVCGFSVIEKVENFCPHCGQALDWRNDNAEIH